MLEQDYVIQWDGRAPGDVILDPINVIRYCPVLIENVLFSKGLELYHFPKIFMSDLSKVSAISGSVEARF